MTVASSFEYAQAFVGHRGLLTPDEQSRLRAARIGLPGLGGAGSAHLLTLTRLGIGRFVLSDPDSYELRNFNRQAGATVDTIGRPKPDVMAALARAINPELDLRIIPGGIAEGTINTFLDGCDAVVDGLDFFAIKARRLLFARARERGVPVVTCGPMGFSAALLVFLPGGPSFDAFFDLHDGLSELEQLARFAVGLAPAGLHVPYIDPAAVSLAEHRGPSSFIAINLCAAVAATEVLALLLRRRPVWAVPRYAQFDPYRLIFRKGALPLGNRDPRQRLKLWALKRILRRDFAGARSAA